ncbi:conjugal transfer protein [Lichenibacterium minor]|uniref:Conjugal transfer protein n=1 Tax=Lichenibacterium minor TaxID=2316528 RepID=A0A4Q2U1E7_9HYPH|nr:MobF family relaxase [Lichenibacterium minor]RYC30279.1 conjugal transfer protein [Lichenibacterium minor]
MTASLHRLASGSEAGAYYTNDAAREAKPRNRDEYYSRDGGGTWWSTGETIVRHGAPIDRGSFRALCAGQHPGTGASLVRGAGPGHWAGLDVTFTPGKSVSLLWASGTPELRAAVEEAHRSAVEQALRFVEREGLVLVRSGAGGVVKSRPSDLIVARYDHFTTREGDPNVHTHAVIMNVAGAATSSGRYKASHLTIEPAEVFRWQHAIGAGYRAALAETLGGAGFSFVPAGRGQYEIAGVPQDLIEAFSKRSRQIEERVGRGASGAQKEIAALATRSAKELVPTGEELEARWMSELAASGVDVWAAALGRHQDRFVERDRSPERLPDLDPPEIEGDTPVAVAASALLRHQSVVARSDLLRAALVEAGLKGIGIAPVYAELDRLERDGTLLRLGPERDDGRRWTTPSIARVEAAMLRSVNRPAERSWITEPAVALALERARHLSDEQRDAVRRAASLDGVSIIEAGAGTGKTTAARAIADAAQASGLKVVGLAPSWVAADELAKSVGIEAQAIAKWRHDREHGRAAPLDADTLLIVDEAGMASMRDMAAIAVAAKEAGAKLVLLGDSRQLESVPGGSALRAVTEVVRQNAVMEAVRRQEVDWQRAASVVMARGGAEAGLRAYAERGRMETVPGTEAAMRQAVERWRELRATHGGDVLVITRRNADASRLNAAMREVLRAEGRLAAADVSLPSIDREGDAVALSLAPGDLVRFGDTLPDLGIRNGTRGTVEAVTADAAGGATLRVRLEGGRIVEQPWTAFARPGPTRLPRPPRVVHAYAGTAYSVQGRTAAASVHYIGAAPDAREIYVGLTRHRQDVRIVVERDRLDAACRQRQADPRMAPTATAVAERLFAEASQYGEKANVVDYVADRQHFTATGVVTNPEDRVERRVPKLLEAARGLREALSALRSHETVVPLWRLLDRGRRLVPPLPSRLGETIRQMQPGRDRPRSPDREPTIDR